MTQSNMQNHFEKFISSNPTASYEEWICALHPDDAQNSLLDGLGAGVIIDREYYAEDNECRQFWNSHLGEKRAKAPASPCGSEAGDASSSAVVTDLLGNGETIFSPQSPTKSVAPDEDLLTFD